jgi:flagella basal body P-ring formation protein FlgA
VPGAPKVREYISASLASLYHAKVDDLRLSFDARDQPLLNSSPAGRRISVEPTGTGGSGTMTVRVRQYAGDREVSSDAVSVRVLIRRDVVTTSTSIERGQTIDSAMLNRAEQWLSPAAATPALHAEASGRTARVRIGGGQTITRDMVESPYVVQKGELVEVHCLCGAVQVKASRARAQDKARDGEMVLLKLEGAAKTFQARMNGPGKAVMILEDETNE